jgi:hypothetical protein
MRFNRFPRVEQPSPPSARRVAAAKRVQAEKDRYPLFPELVRYATTESRLDAMQEHRITWWQQHRNHVAASWPELPSDHYRPAPAPGSSVTGKPAHCQVTPSISLACCTTTEQENAVFGTPWPNCDD